MEAQKKNQVKQVPLRQCISCRTQLPRTSLLRLTKLFNTNLVVMTPTEHQFGRSVYVCKLPACINKAIKEKKINKMLRYKHELSAISSQLSAFAAPIKEVRA